MSYTRRESTYLEYHGIRLAGRVELVLAAGGIAYALFLLAGGVSWKWWHHLLLIAEVLLATLGMLSPNWSIRSIVFLYIVPPTTLFIIDGNFLATHPAWAVCSILGIAALAPLPSPHRDILTLYSALLLSFGIGLANKSSSTQGTAAVLSAIALGWLISWSTVETWRKIQEDAATHRQLTDRLSGSRDTLQRAIQQTREELASQQQKLVQQERLATLGRLSAGIAHEINNPLTVALTNLEMASSSDLYEPSMLEDATAALRRIRNIVADLTRVARPGDREEVNSLDLEPIVNYAIDIAKVVVQGQITLEVPNLQGVYVLANRGRLEQVLVNLLVNAWQAMATRQQGMVHISLERHTQAIVVHIDDNGPGIPIHLREEIFEPFFTTKPAGEGSGLGLALSRSYMRAMEGDLTASVSPLGGARLSLRLLIAHEHLIKPSEPPIDPPSLPTGEYSISDVLPHLLIVDDEAGLRRSLARGLRKQWRVSTAANGQDAKTIIEKDKAHAVLCDLVLLEEDGIEIIQALEKIQPGIQQHTLLMSGEPTSPTLRAIARANSPQFVRKPFELEELGRCLIQAQRGFAEGLNLDLHDTTKNPRNS